jgi:hypothetical protein
MLMQNDSDNDANNASNDAVVNNVIIEKKKRGRKKKIYSNTISEESEIKTDNSEEVVKVKAEKVAKVKAEEVAKVKAEKVAKVKAEKVAKVKAEKVAKVKAEKVAKVKAEKVAKVKAEKVAKVKADNPENYIIDTTSQDCCQADSCEPVVVHKKRGRKPRGGKIIQENHTNNINIPEVPNIILHLKCVLSDLKTSNQLNSNKIDNDNDNDNNYNNNINTKSVNNKQNKHSKGGEKILCYNDQSNSPFGCEVLNYNNDSTDSSDSNSNSPKCSIPLIPTIMIDSGNKHACTNDECQSVASCTSASNIQYDPMIYTLHKTAPLHASTNHTNNNSDSFSDADNINMKDVWKKISQLKLNFHKSDTFHALGGLGGSGMHRSACFWCTCDFDTPPIYIPKTIIKDSYNVYGCFCHPECAAAFLMSENIDTSVKFERYYLLNSLYGPVYKYNKSIKPAPSPYYLLNKFYGNLTIGEYRKLFQCEQLVYVVNKPLTHILPELYEDNNDFLVGNKIIQNSTIQLKNRVNKNAKTNIINEAFGMK